MERYWLIYLASMLMISISYAQHPYARYDYPHGQGFFSRGGFNPFPSYLGGYKQPQETQLQPEGRLFFTTLTITISTATATSTSTSTTTCTTSTATLSTCTPGRRRRHATSFADGKKFRGLLYDEDDELKDDDVSNIFLSNTKNNNEEEDVMRPEPSAARPVRENPAVPYMVQPGFRAPDSVGSGRFLLSFFTTTTTTTTSALATATLTATCSSQTSWPTCGSGK